MIKLTKEAKIGIVTIISLGLLYFGINYLKGVNLFKPVNHYYVTVNNAKDVTVSSPVYVEGFKVGLVRSLAYDYENTGKITIVISLDNDMKVNKGSYIEIASSFLSGASLNLHLNKYVSEYMKSGETIEGRMGEDMMESIQNNILPSVEVLLPKIDSILTGLQTLVNHPALSQSLVNLEQTTVNLNASSRQLNQLLNKDVPLIVSDLKSITTNFNDISENLKGLDLQATVNSVNATLANLQITTEKINSKDNTLGLLLNDKTLYNNLNGTMDNASKLLLDFRENPKRYVHFSLF